MPETTGEPNRRQAPHGSVRMALAVCVLTGTLLGFTGCAGAPAAQQTTEKIVPFTLVQDSYNFRLSPEEAFQARSLDARRSDGTTVRIETILGNTSLSSGPTRRDLTFADGHFISFYDDIHAKERPSNPLTGAVLARWQARFFRNSPYRQKLPENCALHNDTFKGYTTLDGERVAIVEFSMGLQEWMEWEDPKLGCRSVQQRISEKQVGGSEKPFSALTLRSLKLGEPNPDLFAEGKSYTEMEWPDIRKAEVKKLRRTGNTLNHLN